jgi:hypothetical protein
MSRVLRDEQFSDLPYGALPYFQIHYIVACKGEKADRFLARCVPITKGRFSNKRVVDVKWTGITNFADILQADLRLTEMLKEVLLHEHEIRVDPVGSHVRIYGKNWSHEYETSFSQAMTEIADRIAGHIKTLLKASIK